MSRYSGSLSSGSYTDPGLVHCQSLGQFYHDPYANSRGALVPGVQRPAQARLPLRHNDFDTYDEYQPPMQQRYASPGAHRVGIRPSFEPNRFTHILNDETTQPMWPQEPMRYRRPRRVIYEDHYVHSGPAMLPMCCGFRAGIEGDPSADPCSCCYTENIDFVHYPSSHHRHRHRHRQRRHRYEDPEYRDCCGGTI